MERRNASRRHGGGGGGGGEWEVVPAQTLRSFQCTLRRLGMPLTRDESKLVLKHMDAAHDFNITRHELERFLHDNQEKHRGPMEKSLEVMAALKWHGVGHEQVLGVSKEGEADRRRSHNEHNAHAEGVESETQKTKRKSKGKGKRKGRSRGKGEDKSKEDGPTFTMSTGVTIVERNLAVDASSASLPSIAK